MPPIRGWPAAPDLVTTAADAAVSTVSRLAAAEPMRAAVPRAMARETKRAAAVQASLPVLKPLVPVWLALV